MPTQRQLRYSEVIRRIISDTISKGNIYIDQFDLSNITISFVKVSKDFKFASVYIMPLGGLNKEFILKKFNENKYIFNKAISKEKLKSKYTPKVKFFLDDTFEAIDKIDKLLNNKKIIRDLKK